MTWEGEGVIIIDKEGSCQGCCSFLSDDACDLLRGQLPPYVLLFGSVVFFLRACVCTVVCSCVYVCVHIIGGLSSTLGVVLQVISTLVLHFMSFIIIV